MSKMTETLPDGRKVTVEIDKEGHVLVSGHTRLIAHQNCQRTEDGLTFNPEPVASCNHISFRTEVTPDGKGITLEIFSGPTPLWPRESNPKVIISEPENGFIEIRTEHPTGILGFSNYADKWPIPWTFERAEAFLDALPDRLTDEHLHAIEAITRSMIELRRPDNGVFEIATRIASYATMRHSNEQDKRENEARARFEELLAKRDRGETLTEEETNELVELARIVATG